MDLTILIAISALVLVAIILILIFANNRKNKSKAENRPRAVPVRARDGAPRRAQMLRNRGVRLRANVQAQESDEEPVPNDDEPEVKPTGKIGAKKQAKLEAKAEKKLQREAEERSREEKKKRQEALDAERKKEEEKELAEEKRREEEERKVREEKEKREYEEYLKMKEAFSVEEEGYEEGEGPDETNLLQEFVNYIKNQKVVIIEDLASKFKLKTQAAIDRIRDLQNDNILTGVIDDRGKFIYVSESEMEAVATFIRQRGRVSIQELSECSNQLINLTPTLAN